MCGRASFLVTVLIALVLNPQARAEERVALVIGNSNYEHAERLVNPANDAEDIATELRSMGFSVRHERDLTIDKMRRALGSFARESARADVALVFYAGHGIEVDRQNYLIPVDAELQRDTDVDYEAIHLDLVMRSVEGARKLKLVLLDSCRVNPFQAQMLQSSRSRSLGRGLARVEPAVGTLVGFAAKEGTVADDGVGRNSPYSAALLKYLKEPGLEINFLFRKVRDDVLNATGRSQEPFVYGSLPGEAIYLTPPADTAPDKTSQPPVSGPVTPTFSEAATVWAVTQNSTSKAVLQAFVDKYPDSIYATFAKARIIEITQAERVARLNLSTPPPVTPPSGTPERAAPELTECDEYASVSQILNTPEPDLLWEELDPEIAIPACERAVAEFPDEPRFHYKLSLALSKADRYDEAARELKIALDAGYEDAFADWAGIHSLGEGVKRDPQIAVEYAKRSIAAGKPHGTIWLAVFYWTGFGVPQDDKKALELFKQSEAMGHHVAPALIGEFYQYGYGVEVDLERARQYYEKGVAIGESRALSDLGWMYFEGIGVEKDEARAVELFRRSAAGGLGAGYNYLGWAYENGRGIEQDINLARENYLAAARKRHDIGMWNAARLIDEEKGGPRDPALVAEYFLGALGAGVDEARQSFDNSLNNWAKESRVAIQSLLQSRGFYTGALDGDIGPNTKAAMESYVASL